MQCVAAVRGALTALPGVYDVFIRSNVRDFSVRYEPDKVGVPSMLTALERIGEPAKPR